MPGNNRRYLLLVGWLLLFSLYAGYLAFALHIGRAGVDYHTFLDIGQRWRSGQPVYVANSYYPLPYVMIFALFAALPLALSMVIWHAFPVLIALWAARWQLWPLAFAPLFAHFVGGQASVVGLIGMVGAARYREDWRGGVLLAVAMLKPHLALLPLLWLVPQWIVYTTHQRRLPPAAASFGVATTCIYLPAFILYPDWLVDWLASPRPFFVRALAAPVPRVLIGCLGSSLTTWSLWALVVAGLAYGIVRQKPSLRLFVWASLLIYPLIQDYDLIILIPLLTTPRLQRAALIAALPLWVVILTAYGNDRAWGVVTLIPLTLTWIAWREEVPR